MSDMSVTKASSPNQEIDKYIKYYLKESMTEELMKEIPKKWEKYGDFVLFDGNFLKSDIWQQQNHEFWEGLCKILNCKRIAIKSSIFKDNFRTPNVKMMVSDDPWINYTDNKIRYTWNVLENMFSAGNAPERHRIAKLNCEDEVVIDLYAGIGYFTLPYLVHTNAKFVYACEWNPNAVIALKKNLKLNKVSDRCQVLEGDNRVTCPVNIADRVNLGLLPTSEPSWKTACLALKPSGGILHVHGNVETKKPSTCMKCESIIPKQEIEDCCVALTVSGLDIKPGGVKWKKRAWFIWSVHVLHEVSSFLQSRPEVCSWTCSIEHVHYVKSYAPHVDHLVADIKLTETITDGLFTDVTDPISMTDFAPT